MIKPYYHDEQYGITIYHGDCRDILPHLEPHSITLLWTDPPYGHGNHNGDLNAALNEHRLLDNQPICNDDQDSMREVVSEMLDMAIVVLNKDCCCCCCCCCGGGGPKPTFAWVANRMDTRGLSFFHSVIWDKVNPGLGWRFRRQHEMIMVSHRSCGKLAWVNNDIAIPNIIKIYPDRNRLHPNEKPLKLPSAFIEVTTKQNDIVLDPFMGSGTTLVAAQQLGRRAIGIEIERKYCDIAIERLRQTVLPLDNTSTHEYIRENKEQGELTYGAETFRGNKKENI